MNVSIKLHPQPKDRPKAQVFRAPGDGQFVSIRLDDDTSILLSADDFDFDYALALRDAVQHSIDALIDIRKNEVSA